MRGFFIYFFLQICSPFPTTTTTKAILRKPHHVQLKMFCISYITKVLFFVRVVVVLLVVNVVLFTCGKR